MLHVTATGMTDSGKQRTPDWLMKLLGQEPMAEDPTGGVTLKSLLGEAAAQ